jgi:flagellar biosynthesis regulator FlbT
MASEDESRKTPERESPYQGNKVGAAVPNGGVLSGAHGVVIPLLADTAFLLKSDATGKVDVQITDTTARTLYVVIVLPNGSLVVSPPVTFV